MTSNNEKLFCSDLSEMLKSDLDLSQGLLGGLEIRAYEKVIYDVTVLYGGSGKFEPKFGFLNKIL